MNIDNKIAKNPVAQNLDKARRNQGFSVRQAAEFFGVHQPTYTVTWKNGNSHQALYDKVMKICEFCNCDPNTLFSWSGDTQAKEDAKKLKAIQAILND